VENICRSSRVTGTIMMQTDPCVYVVHNAVASTNQHLCAPSRTPSIPKPLATVFSHLGQAARISVPRCGHRGST